MARTSHHIIRRQYLRAELNGTEKDGLELQRKLPGLCEHALTPAIEQALDRRSPLDGHVYIERLEIDAGTLTLESLEHDLANAVADALQKALQEQIPYGTELPLVHSGNMRYVTEQHAINEAFLFFLRTGSLPWSFRLPEDRTLEQVILGSWNKATVSGVTSSAVKEPLLRALVFKAVRMRLVRQFSSVFLETLLSLLSSNTRSVMDEIMQALRGPDKPLFDEMKYFEFLLWECMFAYAARGKVPAAKDIINEAWSAWPATATGHDETLASIVERYWPGVTNKPSVAANRNEGRGSTQSDLDGSERTRARLKRHFEASDNIFAGEYTTTGKDIAAEEGTYIDNAGLVLLHPFLPRFFNALGISIKDKLLKPERALCLLHYLTTGRAIAPEYELTLPKILCNVPLVTPVEPDVKLTGFEQEEAVALLEAVIRHWEVLQNTSPDGLRGTYLLRPGKVSMRDNDWLLQVEPRTCDILLNHLPWGISMIKLPWMKKMLWVEWK